MVDVTPATAARTLASRRRERLPVFLTLGRMFQTFARAPLAFIGLAVLAMIPSLLRVGLAGPSASLKLTLVGFLTTTLPGLLLVVFVDATISFLAVRLREGERPPFGETLKVGLQRYLPTLVVTLLTLLAFYAGLILLVVPGLIVACAFAVGYPVCVIERLGPIDSMRRSAALTKGSRWRILGIFAVFFLPVIGLSVAGTFLLVMKRHVVAFFLVTTITSLFTQPLGIILGAEIYSGLRRQKETIGVASVFD